MSNSRMTRWNPEPERVSKDFLVFELVEPGVTVDAATADWLEVLVFAFLDAAIGAARAVWQRSGPVGRPDERLHSKPIEVQTMISSQKMQHWMLRSENEILRDISCHSPSNALSNQQQENNMTTIEHLRAARALIEKGWCRFTTATRTDGYPVSEHSRKATHFCPVGALHRSAGKKPRVDPRIAYTRLFQITLVPVDDWNDTPGRTKADVLALFDKAIEMEERKV